MFLRIKILQYDDKLTKVLTDPLKESLKACSAQAADTVPQAGA